MEQKEKLLSDKIKIVGKNRKRKQKNVSNNLKVKKIKQTSLPYENAFDLKIEEKNTFFATALVDIGIGNKEFVRTKAFMDIGAQPNMVSYSLFHTRLEERVHTEQIKKKVLGINGQSFQIRQKVTLKLYSWFDHDIQEQAVFWIVPKEAGWQPYMPDRRMNPFKHKNPTKVPLADPSYWIPEQVHLLLGVGFFARIIVSVVDKGVVGTAVMETRIGVIIFGTDSEKMQYEEGFEKAQSLLAMEPKEGIKLDRLLERLWLQDQIPVASKLTKEQMEVEKHYLENFRRDGTGRFTVRIPLKSNIPCFGSSREIALKRFMYLEKRFTREPNIKEMYVGKMRESIKLGHLVPATERPRLDEIVYYIPHHCISKENRIVYDASCPTDTGVSLNQIQMLGPKLQKDLFITIMRFRRHRVAIYADIKKMFNQVNLERDQWNLQRIFWRENQDEPLREYWLTVVIFGMTSSAHLAVRSVIQAAREAKREYPEAAGAIENDYYMDDCVTGRESEQEAIKLAKEMEKILIGAGFELRKWKSNSKSVMEALGSNEEKAALFVAEEESTILGLKWLVDEDCFTFMVKNPDLKGEITKRSIASHVAQLYDPNGYITPVIIRGKMLIQDLWKAKVGWDEKLNDTFVSSWIEIWKDIECLGKFKIDRWLATGKEETIQVHGFSDSSERAMGAAIYVRVQKVNGEVKRNLLVTKSRIAPVKTVPIPRLELSAAELLSRLVREVLHLLEWEKVPYFLWTDSSIAFYWIRKEPCTLRTYVANRVSSIQENTKVECWHHIDGKDNPADLLTRGVTPAELMGNELWLHGPEWLSLPQSRWPKSRIMSEPSDELMAEVKVNALAVVRDHLRIGLEKTNRNVPLLQYTAKLERAVNILSYVERFVNIWLGRSKAKRKRSRRGQIIQKIMPPSNEEKTKAMKHLIRKEQQEYFGSEVAAIKAGKALPEKSKLESLRPILDEEELLRLGGRLDRSEIDYEMKHPYIIPHDSRLAHLIMDYAHRQTKHGGVQVMMQYIRQKYWISKLRSALRNVVHKCVVCVRMNAKVEMQLMAELPKERIQVGKAFLYAGVDYAGPFEIKLVGTEDRKKVWIAIFVCMTTRAVHIEIVLSLSSIAFIACYEKFIARRGRCEKIFSDNGTTFTGTDKELRRALEFWTGKGTLDHLYSKGTEWHFMAPAAPHQGGIYEAAVKSMKFHLRRIIGQKVLRYENLDTLLSQVDAILNSRPLHPLSDDPKDMQALTPGHFIVGEPLIVPLPFVIDPKPTTIGIRLWKERQLMVQHFWERWKNEYLVTLQERKKWRKEKENLKIGQLVILKSENFPPSSWAMGRICELLPSKDGLVRTVVVQTATNRLKRSVQKVCVLPIEPEPQRA